MLLWVEVAIAVVTVYGIALGVWPLVAGRSQRFANVATVAAFAVMPFVGLVVQNGGNLAEARIARVLLSIWGAIVGGMMCAYWRRTGDHRFGHYARFLFAGPANPTLIDTPHGHGAPHRAATGREALRLAAAIAAGGMVAIVAWALLRAEEARYWVWNYLIAVVAFTVMMQALGQGLLVVWRLGGFRGGPLADNIWVSRTPAEFWRRWSWPAHVALYRFVYLPFGGRAWPAWGTLMAFLASGLVHEVLAGVGLLRVTGHQLAFFLVSCLGVFASPQLERLSRRGIAGDMASRLATAGFLLATGTLMFATFNKFLHLYHEPVWLAW